MKHCEEKRFQHHCKSHGGFNIEEASLLSLLSRCGYIAERKSGRQRGQNRIMDILLENSQISQRVLQEQLGIEPGSMSEILAKMEEKGFLSRAKDENDRRRMVIRLTEEGRNAARENRKEKNEEDIFSVLSSEEQEQLKDMLKRLLKQWKKERPKRRKMEEHNE